MGLTAEQTKLIKATAPILKEQGTNITKVFYKNMLGEHPELNSIFNMTHQKTGHQARALANSLWAYAEHIDDLGALSADVELIVHKHASLYVQPSQYAIVGSFLLEAMKEVLGDALTPEILDAWTAAYWQLADLLIEKEGTIYRSADGWTDWREFRIDKKVPESEEITSFYLKPVDGKPLPSFRPGQYISVQVEVPALKYLQARQYSLSDKPNPEYYRISVKRESGVQNSDDPSASIPPGHVSNLLHDHYNEGDVIHVSYPCGDFVLDDTDPSSPIVLLAGGVGLTPLTSMLNTVTASDAGRPIHFIHSVRYAKVRAFKDHVLALEKQYPNLQVTLFNQNPQEDEKPGEDYHFTGMIDLKKMDPQKLFLDNKSTNYYVCGPTPFMLAMATALEELGVDRSRIHMELFGTGGVPRP